VRNYDLEFLKKFSMVIGFLMLVTLGLMIAAYFVHKQLPQEIDPRAAKRTENRIGPVGAVYAGATGAASQQAAVAAAAANAASQVAYDGTHEGKVNFDNQFAGCHKSGAGGAPTLDASHWAARIPKGKDTLHKHALEGFTGTSGVMPPKGGNPALSAQQVAATVDWMLDNIK
jgi:cytochrome c5